MSASYADSQTNELAHEIHTALRMGGDLHAWRTKWAELERERKRRFEATHPYMRKAPR